FRSGIRSCASRSLDRAHSRHTAAEGGRTARRTPHLARPPCEPKKFRRTYSSFLISWIRGRSSTHGATHGDSLALLEKLDLPLVLFCGLQRIECPEVVTPAGLRVLLDRVKAILP